MLLPNEVHMTNATQMSYGKIVVDSFDGKVAVDSFDESYGKSDCFCDEL